MVTVNKIGNNLTGTCKGKSFGLPYTEEKHKELLYLKEEIERTETMEDYNTLVDKFSEATKANYRNVISTSLADIVFNPAQNKYFLKLQAKDVARNKKEVISTIPIPKVLMDRISKSLDDDIDVAPLVKFWIRAIRPVPGKMLHQDKLERLCKYIDYTSSDPTLLKELVDSGLDVKTATERSQVYQTPITQEGLLCTYKVSAELLTKFTQEGKQIDRYPNTIDEDTGEALGIQFPEFVEDRVFYPAVQGLKRGDSFWCKSYLTGDKKLGHLIRVGHVHYLDDPKTQINQDDAQTCVKGLHVGNLDYIRGYEGDGTETHDVFVDPSDVWAITNDGSGALRVSRYFVHASRAGHNRGIYHSSKYAGLVDAEWDAIKTDILIEQLKDTTAFNDYQEEQLLTAGKQMYDLEIERSDEEEWPQDPFNPGEE